MEGVDGPTRQSTVSVRDGWKMKLSILFRFLLFLFVACQFSADSFAEDANEVPKLAGCPTPSLEIDLQPDESKRWTACEKWVWSCIVRGKEANLFAKKCTLARPDGDEPNFRKRYKFEPFLRPDIYKTSNAIGSGFLRSILWKPEYVKKITPVGVRIFGCYFERQLNLENITTEINLVLDGCVFKRGVRLTNYSTSKNVSFDGANVRGQLRLTRARIDGSLFMDRGAYDFVDIRDSRLGASLEASHSIFNDTFRMDRADIRGKVQFIGSKLTVLSGWGAKLGGHLRLGSAEIRFWMDLSGSTVNGNVQLQRVRFGRHVKDRRPSCDWDPNLQVDSLLRNAVRAASKFGSDAADQFLNELVYSRPTAMGATTSTPCDQAKASIRRYLAREVLLRDMRINGTLCIVDTRGDVQNVARADGGRVSIAGSSDFISRISLDGTHASSTVLRWRDGGENAKSKTLWSATNFTTGHMLLWLGRYPDRHFFDNWQLSRISFINPTASTATTPVVYPDQRSLDNNRGLCDVTPRRETIAAPDDRRTQAAINDLFLGSRKESQSHQPLSKIVKLLQASDVDTTFLRIKMSKYVNRNTCATSQFTKSYRQSSRSLLLPTDLNFSRWLQDVESFWRRATSAPQTSVFHELLNMGADGICRVALGLWSASTSYGHEPFRLFYFFGGFIGLFWLLLKLDRKTNPETGATQKLGFIYALDTFVPLSQLRIDQDNAQNKPLRSSLRLWLAFHRLAGLVVCIAIFALVLKAA